jgi:hypothetical protein
MFLALILSAASLAAPAPAAELTAKEREFAVQYLEDTRRKFVTSVEGVTDAQWTFRAGPDRWSIAEVAEHIAISESTILGLVTEKILGAPPLPPGEERMPDEKLLAALTDRTAKFQAPEMLRPANRWKDRASLVKDFNAARDKTIAYIKETKDDLRGHAAPHPVLKSLDGYQWVLLIGGHAARHTAQIEEVKTAANYPK